MKKYNHNVEKSNSFVTGPPEKQEVHASAQGRTSEGGRHDEARTPSNEKKTIEKCQS